MTDADSQTQTLIPAPSQQTAINVGAPEQGRPTRAYKIAGLTLLACALILSQAVLAYFLLSQRDDIKSLKDQGNRMNSEMSRSRSDASVQMRAPMRIDALPSLMDTSLLQEDSTPGAPKRVPELRTKCLLEAAGLSPLPVPGFYPQCDEQGGYKARQCFRDQCWCVEHDTGNMIPGTQRTGDTQCNTAVFLGKMSSMTSLDMVD